MNKDCIIQVEGLERHFKMGRETVKALAGVSMVLRRGEFLGISGPSGSGKSTLMYLLGGLDHPTSGKIWVEGQDLTTLDEDELAIYRQRKIGFMYQMFNLIPSMTALENVEFPLLFSAMRPRPRRERAHHVLELVGLADRVNHRPPELSGGQQQRVAIARALVNDPAIVLADEPTGNLDSRSGGELIILLKQLTHEGRTVVIVSHDQTVMSVTDRSLYLRDGIIVKEDLPERSSLEEKSHA